MEETAEAVRRCQSSSEGGAEKKSVRLEARSVSAGKRVLFLRVGRTSAEVTVRISIHSHILVAEPFLVMGLIASIRRILVITLEAATLTKDGTWSTEAASILFRASMIELGLLALLIIILVFSITLLRRYAPQPKSVES
jgi:Flp pilus assembly CpaF family ATPase